MSITFLALPPFIKSASDVIGSQTVRHLNNCGVSASLKYIGSERMARLLLASRSKLGHLIYKYLVSPWCISKLVNRFGSGDIVWTYETFKFANLTDTSMETHVRRAGAKLVFQLHDDWLSVPGYREAALARFDVANLVGGVTGGILDSIRSCRNNLEPALLRAPIDVERLAPVIEASAGELPKVVWTGNPNNLKEIPGAMEILKRVHARAAFRFLVISGAKRPHLDLPIPWEWLPYDAEREAGRISGACAGLAPLEDTPYARCKDVFKVKTYMACGVPPIATAIGNNLDVIRDDKTGYLVSSSREWEARLLELVSNPEKPKMMGAAAREDCVKRFSHAAIIPEWIEVVEAKLGRIRNPD